MKKFLIDINYSCSRKREAKHRRKKRWAQTTKFVFGTPDMLWNKFHSKNLRKRLNLKWARAHVDTSGNPCFVIEVLSQTWEFISISILNLNTYFVGKIHMLRQAKRADQNSMQVE